jgi:hypothetical protein
MDEDVGYHYFPTFARAYIHCLKKYVDTIRDQNTLQSIKDQKDIHFRKQYYKDEIAYDFNKIKRLCQDLQKKVSGLRMKIQGEGNINDMLKQCLQELNQVRFDWASHTFSLL